MLKFLKQVQDYAKESVQAAKYIGQGLSVTLDRKSTRLNSSHSAKSRMPSSA